MRYYPIYIDTRDGYVLLVGGGETATAKLKLLLKTQAHIRLVAPVLNDTLGHLVKTHKQIEWHATSFDPSHLDNVLWAYAAHDDDEKADERVVSAARQRNVMVNWVDHGEQSDFLTPALVDRSPVTVAIGTEGAAPVLARRIKASLEEQLNTDLGIIADTAQSMRDQIDHFDSRTRRILWQLWFQDAEKVYGNGGVDALRQLFNDVKRGGAEICGCLDYLCVKGQDADDLTLKARKALDQADVVVSTRRVPHAVMELVRREALVRIADNDGQTAITDPYRDNQRILRLYTPADVVRLKTERRTLARAGYIISDLPSTAGGPLAQSRPGHHWSWRRVFTYGT